MRARNPVASRKRRKKVLKQVKGYWGQRSTNYRRAIETLRRAYVYAYRDRRTKKRTFRSLWINRLNAAARARGISYRSFIDALKKKKIVLSRNILAIIAAEYPLVFDKLAEEAKK